MFRHLLLSLFAASVHTTLAAPVENPILLLERGIFAMDNLHDTNRAKGLFREVIASPKVPERLAAEALWHMADAYRIQGSDDVAVLSLNKLVRDYPNAQPYARQAAEESVELSRTLEQSPEIPNLADFHAAKDMMLILQAAREINSAVAVRSTLRDLRDIVGSMIFELSLPQANETNRERRQREKLLVEQQEILGWIEKSQQETDLKKITISAFAEAKGRTRIEPLDLNTQLYTQRDAFTEAIGTGDVAKVEQVLGSFAATFQPFLGGPSDLGLVEAFTGELKAARAATTLATEGEFEQALQLWREARLAFLNSNMAGMGLLIYEIDLIPESFRSEFVAAIMFVESAVYDLLAGGRIRAATRSVQKAHQRLKALLEKEMPAEAKARIQRTVQRLTESLAQIKAGEDQQAAELLRVELYVSKS